MTINQDFLTMYEHISQSHQMGCDSTVSILMLQLTDLGELISTLLQPMAAQFVQMKQH